MKCLLITILALASFADCGVSRESFPHNALEQVEDNRIVGGTEAKDHAHPFAVSLGSPTHFCGGAILNQWYILTAAHCLDRRTVEETQVLVGSNSLSNSTGTGQTFQSYRFHIHEKFTRDTMENDIALIRLERPLSFQQGNVQPIPLQLTMAEESVMDVILAGWGLTSYWNSKPSEMLQEIHLKTMANEECHNRLADIWPITNWTLTDCHVCAEHDPSGFFGACSGDSGSSLIAQGKTMGVVSWGVPCGEGYPEVYTRVSCYGGWIRSIIEKGDVL